MTKLFDRYLSLMEMTREQFFTCFYWFSAGFVVVIISTVLCRDHIISGLANFFKAFVNLRG